MSWRGGYVADVAYASGVYREMAPAHLSACVLVTGLRPPDPAGPFRYLELGCGAAFGLVLLAAANPGSRFLGIDFNPAHVASAEQLIRDAELDNVEVREASFADFALEPLKAEERFHYVVAHGVWTWIAREMQQDMVRIFANTVRPGGLAYVSYNNMAGWVSALTLQKLIWEHAQRVPGDSLTKIRSALEFALSLRASAPRGVSFKRIEQTLGSYVDALDDIPPAILSYLAHEYLNEHWRPVFPTDVEADLAEAKLSFVASAGPLNLLPGLTLTRSEEEAAETYPDAAGRRRLGDLLGASPFRRDIFARGPSPIPPALRDQRLREISLMLVIVREGFEFEVETPSGKLELDKKVYEPIFNRLKQGPATVGELADDVAAQGGHVSPVELMVVLMGCGMTAPVSQLGASLDDEAGRLRSMTFNRAMMKALREQAGKQLALASVKLGSGVPAHLDQCLAYLTLAAPDFGDRVLEEPALQAYGRENEAFWRMCGVL